MFRALRIRLAIGNALLLATLLAGLGFVGTRVYRERIDRVATAELLSVARTLASVVAREGVAAIPDHHADPSDATIVVGVFDAHGGVLRGSPDVPDWLRPRSAPLLDARVADEDPVRFVTRAVVLPDGSPATLVVARSLERLLANADDLEALFRSGLLEVVLLSAVFGWWISGRMIRPIARSFEAQRAFAADASHELRTPLTFIRTGVEVLAETKPDLGRQVLEEVDYMTSLTERLLLLARAEDGALRTEPVPFPAAEVSARAIDRARGAHGITVELRADGAPIATGDPVLTATILDALLENAARYGGARCEVRVEGSGRSVTIAVADRGPGMSGEAIARIFDRFARLERSRDRDSGGAGLGLPLARGLARAQGGDLRLTTTPGGGLTATLELPVGATADRIA